MALSELVLLVALLAPARRVLAASRSGTPRTGEVAG
jgi:hypothetical protein